MNIDDANDLALHVTTRIPGIRIAQAVLVKGFQQMFGDLDAILRSIDDYAIRVTTPPQTFAALRAELTTTPPRAIATEPSPEITPAELDELNGQPPDASRKLTPDEMASGQAHLAALRAQWAAQGAGRSTEPRKPTPPLAPARQARQIGRLTVTRPTHAISEAS